MEHPIYSLWRICVPKLRSVPFSFVTRRFMLFFTRDLTRCSHFVYILYSHSSPTTTLQGDRMTSHFTGEKSEVWKVGTTCSGPLSEYTAEPECKFRYVWLQSPGSLLNSVLRLTPLLRDLESHSPRATYVQDLKGICHLLYASFPT